MTLTTMIQEFEGRTRTNFAGVNQRFDDLDGKGDGIVGQLGEVLELLRAQN